MAENSHICQFDSITLEELCKLCGCKVGATKRLCDGEIRNEVCYNSRCIPRWPIDFTVCALSNSEEKTKTKISDGDDVGSDFYFSAKVAAWKKLK